MKEVLAEILKMSTEEKILLVEAIWDNISEESMHNGDVSEEEKNVLNDRLEAYRKNPNNVRTWDEFTKDFLKNNP